MMIFLTHLISSIVQKEISLDEEIDLFSSPSSSVQTGIPPTRTISISQDALEQMQEMNRVMINQRMEINHLKAQLARCVAGRDMAENVLDGNVPSANAARPLCSAMSNSRLSVSSCDSAEPIPSPSRKEWNESARSSTMADESGSRPPPVTS